MFWFYQSLLMKNAFPVAFQGFIPAAFNLGAMLLLLTTGFFQKNVGTRRTLFLSSLIPGLMYLGVFFLPGLPMALVAIFVVPILKIFRAPMLTTLMNERIGDANRATVLSGVSMLERIMTTAFYPLAGMLTDISLEWTFLAMGIITVLVSVFLQVEDRHFES
jgi:MFS family permease